MVTIVSLIVVVVIGIVVGPWARRLGQSYRDSRHQAHGVDEKDSHDF